MDKTRVHPKIDIKKLLKQAAGLKEIAKKKGWGFYYDSELDEFYFSPKTIPSDNLLISINNELAVYVDSKSNLNGIFIEYFKSNFIKHEEGLEKLPELFTKRSNGVKTIPKRQERKLKTFEDTLKGKILSRLIFEAHESGLAFV